MSKASVTLFKQLQLWNGENFCEDMEVHKTTRPLVEIECPIVTMLTCNVHVTCKLTAKIANLWSLVNIIWLRDNTSRNVLNFPYVVLMSVILVVYHEKIYHSQTKVSSWIKVVQCEYYSMGWHVTMVHKDQHIHERDLEKMEVHLFLTKSEQELLLTKSKLMDIKLR